MAEHSGNVKVHVLRLSHRIGRDKRVTMHLLLTARAFGAEKVIYTGQRDEGMEKRIRRVVKFWGGPFEVEYRRSWKQVITEWRRRNGEIIHLTMYGLPVQDVISKIKSSGKDKLIVVGSEKVPRELYEVSDWNVSVTSQPHSEISALCIFLHEFFGGKELSKKFSDAKIELIPQPRGKKVIYRGR